MEIVYLIDRLESLINEAKRLPLTSGVIVNQDEFLKIIDQMRINIPLEIREARRLKEERKEVIARAQAEAEKIVAEAKGQVDGLLTDEELLKAAREESAKIIEQARREAEKIRKGADEYAIEVLGQLQDQLMALQTTIQNGLDYLQGPASRE
ncbi:MAG TPA: ATPase [Chloroflexi bacterium]|nr:ATPase [Chloroflexota bacterium]